MPRLGSSFRNPDYYRVVLLIPIPKFYWTVLEHIYLVKYWLNSLKPKKKIIPTYEKGSWTYNAKGQIQNSYDRTKNYFNSFFDQGTGQVVWNREQLREREKKGQVMMTHNEAERYAKMYKQNIAKEASIKSRKEIERSVQKLYQGQTNINVS